MTEQQPAPRQAGPLPTLDSRVKLLEGQVAKGATVLQRPELAQRAVTNAAVETQRDITIVVAGETSRGKSTLVNALLGRPGLLPAEADVTTNVYIQVRYGQNEHARIVVDASGAADVPTVIEAPLASVGDWATVTGNPDNRKSVGSVELFIDQPLLARGLTIIDTPGVGGIEAAHADMTLVALSHADALMFVKAANAPISGPEAAFLTRAAERIETVIICLTKTDLFPGWQTVAAQDAEFLGRYLPRFKDAPILPVSAVNAEMASAREAAGRLAVAEQLRAGSGLAELTDAIDARVVTPGVALRTGNRIRGVLSVIDELERHVRARVGSAKGDSRHRAELEAAHAQAQSYRQDSSGWKVEVGDSFQGLRSSLIQGLNRGLHEIRTGLPATNVKNAAELPAFAEELQRRLNDIVVRLNAGLLEGIDAIGARLRETLTLDGIDLQPQGIDTTPEVSTDIDAAAPPETDSEKMATVARSILSTLSPAITLNFIGGFLSLAAPPVFAAGLVIGIGLSVVDRITRTKARDLNAARQAWQAALVDATGRAQIDIPHELNTRLLTVQRAMEKAVQRAVELRIVELSRQENELKNLLQAEHNVKQKAIKDAETNLKALQALRAKAEAYLTEGSLGAALAGRSAARGQAATDPVAAAAAPGSGRSES